MIELPDVESYMTVADWVEINIATTASAISKADVSSWVENYTDEEISEAFLSSVWNELSFRRDRYNNPPYNVLDRRVIKNDNSHQGVEYIACLILSLFGASGDRITGTKMFERLSALALKEYMKGEAFIFGWPVLEGTEVAISQRVREVSERLLERFVEAPAARYKDRGVDIIAWKPFGEGRSSQCVILAQCASGKGWQNKTRDLPIESWKQYIHWASNPITAFFVPCIIPDDIWHDISKEAGILFDRVRIMNLLPNGVADPILNKDLYEWTSEQIAEVSIE